MKKKASKKSVAVEVPAFVVKQQVEVEFFEKDDVSGYNNKKPFRLNRTTPSSENWELQSVTVTAPCGETQQFSRRDFKNLLDAGYAYLEATK